MNYVDDWQTLNIWYEGESMLNYTKQIVLTYKKDKNLWQVD
jgi:hypothetical protein